MKSEEDGDATSLFEVVDSRNCSDSKCVWVLMGLDDVGERDDDIAKFKLVKIRLTSENLRGFLVPVDRVGLAPDISRKLGFEFVSEDEW